MVGCVLPGGSRSLSQEPRLNRDAKPLLGKREAPKLLVLKSDSLVHLCSVMGID